MTIERTVTVDPHSQADEEVKEQEPEPDPDIVVITPTERELAYARENYGSDSIDNWVRARDKLRGITSIPMPGGFDLIQADPLGMSVESLRDAAERAVHLALHSDEDPE